MAKGYCPECNVTINLGKSPRKGQRTACFRCGAELHVANLSPIELDLAFDEFFDNGVELVREHTRKN
jgi:lysine biosynthesis protein LysW